MKPHTETENAMSMSRRSLVISAAALPLAAMPIAAALPALAIPSPLPADPIFAAIKKHRRLYSRLEAAGDELEEAENNLPDYAKKTPRISLYPKGGPSKTELVEETDELMVIRTVRGPPTGEMYWATSREDIQRSASEIPKEHRTAWLADRHAAFTAQERAKRAAEKSAGLTRAQKRFNTADYAVQDAGQALMATRPTTLAGTLALIATVIKYRDDLMDDDDGDAPYTLLRSIADVLSSRVPDEIAQATR